MTQNLENKMELSDKQYEDKDWEDARNVQQGPRRNKKKIINNE